MINLLPAVEKREIAAGRTNRLLLRFIVMLGIFAVIIALLFAAMFLFLMSEKDAASRRIEDGNRRIAELKTEQSEVDNFTNDLKTIKDILDNKVDYSDAVYRVAATLPTSTIVPSLDLSVETVGQNYEITAAAKDQDSIHRLKEAFNSSPFFTNARFNQVARNDESPSYPYTITMTVTPTKELFYGSK